MAHPCLIRHICSILPLLYSALKQITIHGDFLKSVTFLYLPWATPEGGIYSPPSPVLSLFACGFQKTQWKSWNSVKLLTKCFRAYYLEDWEKRGLVNRWARLLMSSLAYGPSSPRPSSWSRIVVFTVKAYGPGTISPSQKE